MTTPPPGPTMATPSLTPAEYLRLELANAEELFVTLTHKKIGFMIKARPDNSVFSVGLVLRAKEQADNTELQTPPPSADALAQAIQASIKNSTPMLAPEVTVDCITPDTGSSAHAYTACVKLQYKPGAGPNLGRASRPR